MITCPIGSLIVINSSKSILIISDLKFVEKVSGWAFTNLGGVTSLGPPVGATILAQEAIIRIIKNEKRERINFIRAYKRDSIV
jgi:hypothetical protein